MVARKWHKITRELIKGNGQVRGLGAGSLWDS